MLMLCTKGILVFFKVALNTKKSKYSEKFTKWHTELQLQFTSMDLNSLEFGNVQQGTRFNQTAQHLNEMASFYAKDFLNKIFESCEKCSTFFHLK